MKKSIYRSIKPVIVCFAFAIGYFLSVLFNHAFMFGHGFSGFFESSWLVSVIGVAITVICVLLTKLNCSAFSFVSFTEFTKATAINFFVFLGNLILCLTKLVPHLSLQGCVSLFLITQSVFFGILFSYRCLKAIIRKLKRSKLDKGKRTLIVGAGDAGATIAKELIGSTKLNSKLVGFVDRNPAKQHSRILGYPVFGYDDDIKKIVEEKDIESIIIAIPSASPAEIKRLFEICIEVCDDVKTLPGLYQLINGNVSVQRLRNVDVNDLLGRDPINVNLEEIAGYIENQVVMVTGGGGSIGSELCRQIALSNPKQLIILDIYENNAYEIEQELKRKHPSLNLVTLIASVRDSVRMDDVFKKYMPDIVFHAAAHKHVPLMETSPNEAVKNNIIGTYKVVKCADKYGVKRFVQISTDKAVNPTNIMGATKRVCEMIIQLYAKKSKTRFVAVRFGNVLGSNGSVIPLFKKQIEVGGPVTVTHKDIIRYFMTIPEAVSLVLEAGAYAEGGEIFVLDMGEQVRIYDLAKNLIRLSGYEPNKDIKIEITGLRPGEKLYEERLMEEEGLTRTDNDKISIGKPIDFDEKKLLSMLDKLYDEAYHESEEIKELVKELVPTYKVYAEKTK